MSLVLAFDDETPLAQSLAAAAGWRCERIDRHRFPDGETRLRLPPRLPAHELGAEKLTLISPYLAYMRQDIAFTPGEVVSQRHLGRLLAAFFDAVVTVDPHLHRVATMDEVVPGRRGVALISMILVMTAEPATATATSMSPCRACRWPVVPWCCSTTSPAPAARW